MQPLSKEALTINTYLLLISPNTLLTEKINALKQQFAERYKVPEAAKAKPHITLATFQQLQLNQDKIVHQLKCIANRQAALKIELQNFGSFPAHTIYINVLTKSPLQDLVKAIRTPTQRLFKLDKDRKPHYILESHITIARRLQPWQYEQAWLEYSHSSFSGTFIADKMVLLRRSEKDTHWHLTKEFYFNNENTVLQQPTLF